MNNISSGIMLGLCAAISTSAFAADTLQITFHNASTKTISLSGTQVCGGATCTTPPPPTSISVGGAGVIKGTATISLATLQYRYGAIYNLVTKTCRASMQLRTSNGTCELINVSIIPGDDLPTCTPNSQNVTGTPATAPRRSTLR